MQRKPHQALIKIGKYLNTHEGVNHLAGPKGAQHHRKTMRCVNTFRQCEYFKSLNLSVVEVLVLASIWHEVINESPGVFTSLNVLSNLLSEDANPVDHLDIIIGLLEKQMLFTAKKRIMRAGTIQEPIKRIRYTKRSLLDENILLHHNLINILMDEPEDVDQKKDLPFTSNKEFLSDWFAYTTKLSEMRYYDFKEIRFNEEMDGACANDVLEILNWKDRLESRTAITEDVFPLQDIAEEYGLDDNETTMLIYLVKEELDGSSVDIDELLKLVSQDQHSLYQNRQYLSAEASLVRNGIIELTENMSLMSRGTEVRATPDIMKQIILDTPINDDERLEQILKGNDIFTLLDPNYTMDDLILDPELKQTMLTSISRYSQNVDSVLEKWGLYDGSMDVVGLVKKKTEPGLLMLLHGPSGTGKTFASGAIARHLGKKLLVTDISRLQSKWVGDSEKNIQRLFTIFERIVRRVDNPPVLLLNEADQFLSTRLTETNTSVDQMRNGMQNLFLEGFERLKGVMIATTNLHENMDSAFSRRFHLKLELPIPAKTERVNLWELHLPPGIPRASDVNTETLANTYAISGGQIKIIVQNAATEVATRKGKTRVLKQDDLVKYCNIEIGNGTIKQGHPMGFAVA